jgi:predicted dienelactone hydrolase
MRLPRPCPATVAAWLVVLVLALTPLARAAQPVDGDDLEARGPWAVASMLASIPSPRGGFEATVVHPVDPGAHPDASGRLPLADGPHPAVVFAHGYLGQVEWYAGTLEHLASWGFVVVAPRSALEPLPDQEGFVDDLSRSIDWLEAEDARTGSWLEGRLARGAFGTAGHSMGGGASIVAAARDERIRAVGTLAAALSRAGALDAASALTVPLLLVAAGDDVITPVGAHQRRLFEAASVAPVQLAMIEGGGHCGFLRPPPFGDVLCGANAIPRDRQLAAANLLLTGWFLRYLGGREDLDDIAWPMTPPAGLSVESRGAPWTLGAP